MPFATATDAVILESVLSFIGSSPSSRAARPGLSTGCAGSFPSWPVSPQGESAVGSAWQSRHLGPPDWLGLEPGRKLARIARIRNQESVGAAQALRPVLLFGEAPRRYRMADHRPPSGPAQDGPCKATDAM